MATRWCPNGGALARATALHAVSHPGAAAGLPPVACDQARPDSDLDLLVDLHSNAGLLERIALTLALEDTLTAAFS
jgi:hypothetical protein